MNDQGRLVDKSIGELTINSTGRAGFRTFRLLDPDEFVEGTLWAEGDFKLLRLRGFQINTTQVVSTSILVILLPDG